MCKQKRLCLNCKQKKRDRGVLCWVCYKRPEINEKFKDANPMRLMFTQLGIAVTGYSRKLPAHSTDEPPGSLAKILVMIRRLRNNEHIFHPHDNRVIDHSRTNEIPNCFTVIEDSYDEAGATEKDG